MLSIYLRQYVYFCTSKARTFVPVKQVAPRMLHISLRQYLYFCTSKASKLRTSKLSAARPLGSTIYWKLLSNHLFFFFGSAYWKLLSNHFFFLAVLTGSSYRTKFYLFWQYWSSLSNHPLFFWRCWYWKLLSNHLCFMLNIIYIMYGIINIIYTINMNVHVLIYYILYIINITCP